jgi:hypothetical protein
MTVCAWCGGIIATPAAMPQPAVSHGLCRTCLTRELVRLRPTVSPPPSAETPLRH